MIAEFFTFLWNVLTTYYIDVIVIAAAISLGYFAYWYSLYTGNWDKLRRILLTLIIEAEKYIGTSTGEQKKQLVIQWLRDRYPIIKFFVKADTISKLIEDVLRQLKESLAQNNANLDTLENNLLDAKQNN